VIEFDELDDENIYEIIDEVQFDELLLEII